jgi:predicted RNA-binding protein with RPS1 domain
VGGHFLRYRIGQLIKGKVSKLASFGAFVELEEGVDGLVHISQISDEHVSRRSATCCSRVRKSRRA